MGAELDEHEYEHAQGEEGAECGHHLPLVPAVPVARSETALDAEEGDDDHGDAGPHGRGGGSPRLFAAEGPDRADQHDHRHHVHGQEAEERVFQLHLHTSREDDGFAPSHGPHGILTGLPFLVAYRERSYRDYSRRTPHL